MFTPPLYDYDHASQLTFYAPETIRAYCDNGTLARGVHFIVRTYWRGRIKRRVRFILPAGIAHLLQRQTAKPKHAA